MEQQRAIPGWLREWPEADLGLPVPWDHVHHSDSFGVWGQGCENVHPQNLHKAGNAGRGETG